MSDLTPLYPAANHGFVMEPLAMSGGHNMMPLTVTGHFDSNGQFIQQFQAQPLTLQSVAQPQGNQVHLQQAAPQLQQLQLPIQQVQQQQPKQKPKRAEDQPHLTTLQTARPKPSVQPDQQSHYILHQGQNFQIQQLKPQQQQQQPQLTVLQSQQQQSLQLQNQTEFRILDESEYLPNGNGASVDLDAAKTATSDGQVAEADAAVAGAEAVEGATVIPAKKPKKGKKSSDKPKGHCELCNKDFQSNGNLRRHINDFHLDTTEKVTFHCDLCKKDFQNRFNLRRHRLGVHGAKEAKEANGRIYPCDVCGKEFTYSDNLKRHRRNVHGLEGEIVPDTDITNPNSMALVKFDPDAPEDDVGAKEGKAYICEICDKNMHSTYNLKRHKVACHKDTRILYGCDECDKNFATITNYRRHKVMVHGPGKQTWDCDKCGKSLASKNGLQRHMESLHGNPVKQFCCDICGNKFLRKEYLEKHRKTHEFNYEILPANYANCEILPADSTTMASPLSPQPMSPLPPHVMSSHSISPMSPHTLTPSPAQTMTPPPSSLALTELPQTFPPQPLLQHVETLPSQTLLPSQTEQKITITAL